MTNLVNMLFENLFFSLLFSTNE